MARAIARYLPDDVAFEPPAGGLFAWVRLPAGMDAGQVLEAAREEGVAFAPGRDFFVNCDEGARYMRLNFAACTVDEIDEGMQRLGRAIRSTLRAGP